MLKHIACLRNDAFRCVMILRPPIEGQQHVLIARINDAEPDLYKEAFSCLCKPGAQAVEALESVLAKCPYGAGSILDALYDAGLVTTTSESEIVVPEEKAA
jgi:hypothetical protein